MPVPPRGSSGIWRAHTDMPVLSDGARTQQVREQVCLCCHVGTREHGMPANRQAQATVWLPPGHGSCVNRCAKVIRWWHWETGCRNSRTQAACCVAGIWPMLSHREAGTRRVYEQTCPRHQVPVLHYDRYANRWPWRWHVCEQVWRRQHMAAPVHSRYVNMLAAFPRGGAGTRQVGKRACL